MYDDRPVPEAAREVEADRRIARVYRDVRIPVTYMGADDTQRNLVYCVRYGHFQVRDVGERTGRSVQMLQI